METSTRERNEVKEKKNRNKERLYLILLIIYELFLCIISKFMFVIIFNIFIAFIMICSPLICIMNNNHKISCFFQYERPLK